MTWLRKKKRYSRPRKLYDKPRIEEENELVKTYGLKNKKEIWKAEASVNRIRNQAKKLITADPEKQKTLFVKLGKIGLKVETITDVLELNKENWLKRRLQSVLMDKKRVKAREARQLITHKHVLVDGKAINVPSYIVKVEEESNIKIKSKMIKKPEKKEKGDT